MERFELDRRAEIARLLRAGRWLAGDLERSRIAEQRSVKTHAAVGVKVVAIAPSELALREPLVSNWWTANRIHRIERMEAKASPADLDMLERALGLPGLFDQVSAAPSDVDPPDALTRPAQADATTSVRLPRLRSLRVAGQGSDGA